jgi:hypothetical protein
MLKRIIKFSVLIIVMLGIAYAGANLLIDILTNEAIHYLVEKMKTPGLELSELSFDSARISSYNAITWKGFNIVATVASRYASQPNRKIRMNAERLTIETVEFFQGHLMIRMSGLSLSVEYVTADDSLAGQNITTALQEGALAVPLKVNLMNRAETVSHIRTFAAEIKEFSQEGRTVLPIEFLAEEVITLNEGTFSLSVWVEKENGHYRLVANKDDLVFISQNILPENQTSTPADIDIIANNPIKALQLLRIRSKASKTALDAHAKDPGVPESAYRHVLWSYLLTREYGANFAKEVTDAHELTPDTLGKNIPAAEAFHRQDYTNNEVGRRYAQQGFDESKIMNLVMTDPNVIRDGELR